MSKKRGLSYEEKRTKLLEMLHESKDVYTLKELENAAKKEKGIVSQSVKEVAAALVDDGDVMLDKIGTSNYYWSFPSQTLISKTNIIDKLNAEIDEAKRKRDELAEEEAKLLIGREETEEREAKLKELEELRSRNEELKTELQKYSEFDPDVVADMVADAQEARDAANRWTDNIFTVRKWCTEQFSVEEDTFNQNFGVPSELDYVE
jgi:DNA-binding transcriptional regulator GbsR (MarR family)